MTPQKRRVGVLEKIHAIRNDGDNMPDTIALTFNNGRERVRTQNFGISNQHEETIEVDPFLREITCYGEEFLETVTLHNQPSYGKSKDMLFHIKAR